MKAIDNWATYVIHEKGGNLHTLRSDNMVESCFAWVKHLRFHNPFLFTTMFLEKIAVTNAECGEKVRDYKGALTPSAIVDVNIQKELSKEFFNEEIKCVNSAEEKYIVRGNVDMQNRLPFNVDLKNRTCSCLLWVQLGVPCKHAIACINKFHQSNLQTKYFYEWTLTDLWKQIYLTCSMYVQLPDEFALARMKSRLANEGTSITLVALKTSSAQLDSSKKTKKRIQSTGETGPALKSSVKATFGTSRKTRTCSLCRKTTSWRTNHVCKLLKIDPIVGATIDSNTVSLPLHSHLYKCTAHSLLFLLIGNIGSNHFLVTVIYCDIVI